MKRLKTIVVPTFCVFLLSGCSIGSPASSSADQQSFSVQDSSGNNSFTLSGTASGCQSITANGSCGVSIKYTGVGIYAGSLTLSGLNGYTTTIANCNSAASTSTQCSFTISNTNTAVVVTAESAIFIFNGNITESAGQFVVGGGI